MPSPDDRLLLLERRLAHLESRLRFWKRGSLLLALPLLLLAGAAWTSAPKDKELSARTLTIVGADGKKRVVLKGEDPGGWIWLYDKNGNCIFRVGATADTFAPFLELKRDENHQVNVNFAGQKMQPALFIGDPAGLRTILGINDKDVAELMILRHRPSDLTMDAVHMGVHETGVSFLKTIVKGKTAWSATP